MEQHEDINLHISKRTALGLLGTAVMVPLDYLWFLVLVACWEFLKLGDRSSEVAYGSHQLMIVPMLLLTFAFEFATLWSVISIFRKPNMDGLVTGLVTGLVFGLVTGLVTGLAFGLIGGLVTGLVTGLVGGLVGGLFGVLAFGLSE